MLCSYGCGQQGIYKLKCGKICCSKNPSSCPAIKKKNSEKRKQQIKQQKEKGIYICNFHNDGKPSWNKGLTKETDIRVAKGVSTLKEKYKNGLIIPGFLGKKHTDETKLKCAKGGRI